MAEPGASWEQALGELRALFVQESLDRVRDLEHAVADLRRDPADRKALEELHRGFHGFAGSGTTYGFPAVSEASLAEERRCSEMVSKGALPSGSDLDRMSDAIALLGRHLGGEAVEPSAAPTPASGAPAAAVRIVLVAEPEASVREAFTQAADQEGILVRAVGTRAEAEAEMARSLPSALVTNVRLPDGSGYDLVDYARALPGGDAVPVLVTSPMAAFLDKVEAIHCGADGYFEEPIEWDALMRRLLHLLDRASARPSRVLVVEDDAHQAAFARTVLQSAGYEVRVCAHPRHFETDLLSFGPDLVLMDIMLPGASGYDLVRWVRLDERHATLPVIFLTTDAEPRAHIEGARAGGDGHLVKPVSPALLLSTVASRVERARFLRGLLEHDGLTRLLTHTAFLERARGVIRQRERNKSRSCAWVMLDLDHFKDVNDTHGHPVGDRVLTSLAALLRRRLRQTDTVGRYGGEEFAALLDDLQEQDALRLVQRLVDEFAATTQSAPEGVTFHSTFSAGVAVLQPEMTLDAWRQAADDALYAAKAAGRNRVMASGSADRQEPVRS